MDKAWTRYDVGCPDDFTEELAAFVAENLSVSVEINDRGVCFYLAIHEDRGRGRGRERDREQDMDEEQDRGEKVQVLLEEFRRSFSVKEPLTLECSVLEGDDWANAWKAHFKPFRIGSRILVCPTWEKPPVSGAEKVILMDPGQAFGTGHHETTRLCLEWLESNSRRSSEEPPRSLLDVGTGSGILAIAGALLGFDPVVGVDNDPDALGVARENLRLNGLAHQVTLMHSEHVAVPGKFHVIVANIQALPLMAMSQILADRLESSGKLVLSGILCEQQDQVRQAFQERGLVSREFHEAGEWCSMVFQWE